MTKHSVFEQQASVAVFSTNAEFVYPSQMLDIITTLVE